MCKNEPTASRMEEVIIVVLGKAKRHPVPLRDLSKDVSRRIESQRTGRIESALRDLVERGEVVSFVHDREPRYFLAANLERLTSRLKELLKSHHSKCWYEPGMRLAEVRKNFSETQTKSARRNIDERLLEMTIDACMREGAVVSEDGTLRATWFSPPAVDDERIEALEEKVLRVFEERMHQKTAPERLAADIAVDVRLLKFVISRLLAAGSLIEIEDGRYLTAGELRRMTDVVVNALRDGARLNIGDFLRILGRSRSLVVPLMEHLDRNGVTRREGDFRCLVSTDR